MTVMWMDGMDDLDEQLKIDAEATANLMADTANVDQRADARQSRKVSDEKASYLN